MQFYHEHQAEQIAYCEEALKKIKSQDHNKALILYDAGEIFYSYCVIHSIDWNSVTAIHVYLKERISPETFDIIFDELDKLFQESGYEFNQSYSTDKSFYWSKENEKNYLITIQPIFCKTRYTGKMIQQQEQDWSFIA